MQTFVTRSLDLLLKPKLILTLVFFLFLGLFITNGVPYIYGDGYCYYHIGKSIVDHGSFVTPVEPEYIDYHVYVVSYYRNQYVTVCAPGAGIIIAPGLAAAKLFRNPDQNIYSDYNLAFNGHTLAEGIAVLMTANIFGLLTILWIYKSLRNLGYSTKVSIVTTAVGYASSYAIWYVMLAPSYTHTYELAMVALAIWSLTKFDLTKQWRWLSLVGFALGLAVNIRPVLAVVAVVLAITIVIWQRKWQAIVAILAGAIPWAITLMLYNYQSYGRPLVSGYAVLRGEDFTFTQFNGLNILFSGYRGWFIYSPALLLGTIGLFAIIYYAYRRRRFGLEQLLAASGLIAIVANAVIYGFWPAWWSGGSYGHRFMMALMPFALIGLAKIIKHRRNWVVKLKWINTTKLLVVFLIFTTIWSSTLTVLYRITPVAELRPASDRDGYMQSGDRYTPLDMFSYHMDLLRNATSLSDYAGKLIRSARGGNSLIVLPLGIADFAIRLDEREPGLVKIKVIAPPAVRQPLPAKFKYIIKDSKSQKLFYGELTKPQLGQTYTLYCGADCLEISPEASLDINYDLPQSVSRSDYIDMQLKDYKGAIFFSKEFNVQFKGERLPSLPDQDSFVLNQW